MKRIVGVVCLSIMAAVSLPACSKKEQKTEVAAPVVKQKEELIKDFAAVWSTSDETVTIDYSNNQVLMLVGDERIDLTLGDSDVQNETVNLLNASGEITTLRKNWNADKTAYQLSLTNPKGNRMLLGFVRKITNDDKNRIASLANKQAQVDAQKANEVIEADKQALAAGQNAYNEARVQNKSARTELNELWNGLDEEIKNALITEQRQWVLRKKKECGEPNKSTKVSFSAEEFESATESLECDTNMTNGRISEIKGE
jgi:uncharacterized protein YecT (DUF1311 family)